MSAEKSRHNAGWYAGALVFWLVAAWLMTVGLASIIPQIFSPAGDPGPVAAEVCLPTLRALRAELLEHAGSSFGLSPKNRDANLAWFDAWDQRLFRAQPACHGDAHTAWVELNRLRHGLGALSERFEREELPHLERLNQLLGPEGQHAQALPTKNIHE